MRVVLIPCGASEWRAEGRLLGRVEVPLTAAGQQQCQAWIEGLKALGLERIYHAPDELASQTALLIAKRLGIPAKPVEALAEVDIGLWAGLTEEQLRSRYATAHRELCEAPLHVVPPEGESLSDAAERLKNCVCKQIRRNGTTAIGIVTRPLGLAAIRCALEGGDFSELWDVAQDTEQPRVLECDPQTGLKTGVPAESSGA